MLRRKYKVIVVSSAMSGVTNDLVKKSKISNNFISSEYDALVSSGEQMSCALIAGRLNHLRIQISILDGLASSNFN